MSFPTQQYKSANLDVCQTQPTYCKCSVYVTKWASIKTIVSHRANVLDTTMSLLAGNCSDVMFLVPEVTNKLRHHCILQNKSPFSVSKSRMLLTENTVTVESPWLCLGQCEIPEGLLQEKDFKQSWKFYTPLHKIKGTCLRNFFSSVLFKIYDKNTRTNVRIL
jgi:hypothetical protein